ncbi:hypothetical protein [Saccharibacillus kuerlensis]|uniref:Uncharacterized protein n=1 Tax=Saccharibacillus kuerlensis TaxID=459527 RepID=A0ABQ2KX39_9BACL|nr:hypothetical protein [Saccharibacillus kuerlensis]GGN95908.1 hypothetical protein GCM10010969_12260 [Saccharibacillus kuerlensis]
MKNTIKGKGKKVVISLAASMLAFGSGLATSESFAASSNAVTPSQIPPSQGVPVQRWTINAHFTNAEAKHVVAQGTQLAKYSDRGSWIGLLSKFTGLGAALNLYGKSVTAQMTPFKTAIAKGTGVTFKYDYVLPASVSGGSGYIENRSVIYEK